MSPLHGDINQCHSVTAASLFTALRRDFTGDRSVARPKLVPELMGLVPSPNPTRLPARLILAERMI